MMRKNSIQGVGRGRWLGLVGIVVVFALAAGLCWPALVSAEGEATDSSEPKITHYNTLGRTGLKVSDIGLGAAALADPAVIQYALDMGINYIDTAESYAGGRSETAVGQVAVEHRDKMVICTKLNMNGNTTEEEVYARLDSCLARLQTDYVDILMIHGGPADAINNPAIYTAFDKLKEQGKIHWTGISHHGPNIVDSLTPVIEANKLDVILVNWDPAGEPGLEAMLEAAKEKGIGLVAMKVLPSARAVDLEEFDSGAFPFHLAALRWALMESGMHSVLMSVRMMDEVDEYVAVSGAGQEK